jgi:hypothetical protein
LPYAAAQSQQRHKLHLQGSHKGRSKYEINEWSCPLCRANFWSFSDMQLHWNTCKTSSLTCGLGKERAA